MIVQEKHPCLLF